jgi:hypothetical protein
LIDREIKRENSDSSAMAGPDDSEGGDGSSSDVNKGDSMVKEGAKDVSLYFPCTFLVLYTVVLLLWLWQVTSTLLLQNSESVRASLIFAFLALAIF